jgi:hypothetical protein
VLGFDAAAKPDSRLGSRPAAGLPAELTAELNAGAVIAGWAPVATGADAGEGADAETMTGACATATGGVVAAVSCAWIAEDSP